ncbi:glycosyhydrolase [Chryseotalea sanaruensis]|uniref:Glycosyhydrolase n=1 Tax=Chryseotalea sanaruensis TaxID=2482724 RepID=A0A401U5W7_9BACT|nr:glycosyl hydrolase 115 family protein [Chryseotalea sanaruensis]GCC50318.1 glycosyhydrolase [Chryseotalea sanaruensis]
MRILISSVICFVSLLFLQSTSKAQTTSTSVNSDKTENNFSIIFAEEAVPILTTNTDHVSILHAVKNLQLDILAVTDKKPELVSDKLPKTKTVIIAGTIGKNSFIDQLVTSKKLHVSDVSGKWETYIIQVIEKPFKGIDRALVIAGSDKRGTIFGVYEISKQIGVSPWNWWADVTPTKNKNVSIAAVRQYSGEPAVKYRGIFINDEQPALGGWVKENYGGFNSKFYTKVFELILRLKGNFLWPAMWGQSFYTEDPLNPKLADEYGVVISTSHHEPMMRAHVEWQRYNKGKWNYATNEVALREFWREGITRMGDYESVVTLAMRGDGDEPMSEDSNIALLQKIVADQRAIIEEVTKRKVTETPQVWALYKEVQDYYDKGMRVPDDVTLLLCDDNWGNIRKLPQVGEKPRAGGYGIYYHFDYVGGPRNYKWINTNPIERVWEQMHLAYEHKATELWIVNVGDIKPMEFPISFFLDYAWNPTTIKADELLTYTEQWCAQQFGNNYAKEIAPLLSLYLKYNGRVKPELLNEKTYSLQNYNEFETVVNEYQQLRTKAEALAGKLDASKQEAYYQLILHPIIASANLYELYYNVALNHQAAANNDAKANGYADKAKENYKKDSLITIEYHTRNNGKWNHMMSQTHIGYTYWQQPPVNKMPEVKYVTTGSLQTSKDTPPSLDASNLVPTSSIKNIFIERDQYVSIEADHYTHASNTSGITWQVLPNHGKTGSAITAFPVTAPEQSLSSSSPHLAYEFYSYSADTATLQLFFSPTLNFHHRKEGLQYAVSIDDEQAQIFSLNKEDSDPRYWNRWAANNIIIKTSSHQLAKPGKHTIKFWMIHAGPVLQKLVLDFGGVKPSYLGPPETMFNNK